MDILATVAEELGIRRTQAEAAAMLLDEGNTVPFIARYRKEATGSLDDQVLRALADRLTYLRGFEARKQEICDKITEQGNMTEAVQSMLDSARTMAELEDVYRPFRPKRKTRASVAREQGLPYILRLFRARIEDCGTQGACHQPRRGRGVSESLAGAG